METTIKSGNGVVVTITQKFEDSLRKLRVWTKFKTEVKEYDEHEKEWDEIHHLSESFVWEGSIFGGDFWREINIEINKQ